MFQACAQRVAAYQCAIGFVPKTYHDFLHIAITATHMYAPIHTVLCIDRSSAAHRPFIDRSSTTGKNHIDRSY